MPESEAPQEAGTEKRAESAGLSTTDDKTSSSDTNEGTARKRRRRGSRGGRNRSRPRAETAAGQAAAKSAPDQEGGNHDKTSAQAGTEAGGRDAGSSSDQVKSPAKQSGPDKPKIGDSKPPTPSKPKIGDTMPAPEASSESSGGGSRRRRRRRGRGGGGGGQDGDSSTGQQAAKDQPAKDQPSKNQKAGSGGKAPQAQSKGKGGSSKDGGSRDGGSRDGGSQAKADAKSGSEQGSGGRRRRRRGRGGSSRGGGSSQAPVEAVMPDIPVELDEEEMARRSGRQRKGRPVGRYLMSVHVSPKAAQIAVLEGRSMIEHYVSRPSDDIAQIHGNIYLGRVQNVLPGMEAAFVDIGTPKNAVLYRGDVQYDRDDVEHTGGGQPKIEKLLKAGQNILCQVTKNPIGAKGARLTQEVSLPGRHVVLIPNSSTYGISKRLPDNERKRLRQLLDRVKPKQHGIIVRTAAEGATTEEIENDVRRLVKQWDQIEKLSKRSKAPALLYREPDMAVRVIREEFNEDYRGVVIDDHELYETVRDYVASISPALADRVDYYDPKKEKLPLFERYHVHEQLHRALDRKVWLPSGGSLIIETTEALTVIDVNTGKNVGKSSLEETVFKNNLEAAVEVARQLRLRDIGGIIVIDFIDMEIRENRDEVVRVFRDALARDKTRTQVFEISELGLCEMTRKRIGEGLLQSYSTDCPMCEGSGHIFDKELLPDD